MRIPICPEPPRVQRPGGPLKVEGLMLADDLCILTATRRLLALAGNHMITWLKENRLVVGVKKFGIMVVGKNMRILRKEPGRYPISGDSRPIVDAYKVSSGQERALSMGYHNDKARKMLASMYTHH